MKKLILIATLAFVSDSVIAQEYDFQRQQLLRQQQAHAQQMEQYARRQAQAMEQQTREMRSQNKASNQSQNTIPDTSYFQSPKARTLMNQVYTVTGHSGMAKDSMTKRAIKIEEEYRAKQAKTASVNNQQTALMQQRIEALETQNETLLKLLETLTADSTEGSK